MNEISKKGPLNDDVLKKAIYHIAKEERLTAMHFAKIAYNLEEGTKHHSLAVSIFLDYWHEARRIEDEILREILNFEF